MAYVDLRERRGEERRREVGRSSWRGVIEAPYFLLVVGVVLVLPAAVASYTALVWAPPELWVALMYWIPPAALLLWAARRFRRPRGRRVMESFGAEKTLLLAIRDAGGEITPVGAALATPLSVDEAEGILLRLANDGHLRVESHDGTLYYVLPGKLPLAGPLGRQ